MDELNLYFWEGDVGWIGGKLHTTGKTCPSVVVQQRTHSELRRRTGFAVEERAELRLCCYRCLRLRVWACCTEAQQAKQA